MRGINDGDCWAISVKITVSQNVIFFGAAGQIVILKYYWLGQ